MKAIDTNILVRFLLNDDKTQAKRVLNIFQKAEQKDERFFVSALVLLELVWVLSAVYGKSKNDTALALESLLSMPLLEIEKAEAVFKALLDAKKSNFDLADLLIAHCSKAAGGEPVLTFDKRAAKHRLFQQI